MYEEIIKERKDLGLSRSVLSRVIGYSAEWIKEFEKAGERRVSKDFVNAYSNAIKRYKYFLKGEEK